MSMTMLSAMLVVLLAAADAAHAPAPAVAVRALGLADPGGEAFPYAVLVASGGDSPDCAGTLVSAWHVLTHASCAAEGVRVGQGRGVWHDVAARDSDGLDGPAGGLQVLRLESAVAGDVPLPGLAEAGGAEAGANAVLFAAGYGGGQLGYVAAQEFPNDDPGAEWGEGLAELCLWTAAGALAAEDVGGPVVAAGAAGDVLVGVVGPEFVDNPAAACVPRVRAAAVRSAMARLGGGQPAAEEGGGGLFGWVEDAWNWLFG